MMDSLRTLSIHLGVESGSQALGTGATIPSPSCRSLIPER